MSTNNDSKVVYNFSSNKIKIFFLLHEIKYELFLGALKQCEINKT